jgi:hypothetical protein
VNAMIATVNDVLSREIGEEIGSRCDVVFREGAAKLTRTLLPALDWLGTHKDFPLNIDAIRSAFELSWLHSLVGRRIVLLQDRRSGESREFCSARDMPPAMLVPLQQCVAELRSMAIGRGNQASGDLEEVRQHDFVTMYFASGFTKLRCDIAHWVH